MIPPNSLIGIHNIRGMSERCYWCSLARKIEYEFLAALSNLVSGIEMAEIRAADDEIDVQDEELRQFTGTQKQRVLQAVRYGHVNAHTISAVTGLNISTVSAWLSLLCSEGEIYKVSEKNINVRGVARPTNFYRAL